MCMLPSYYDELDLCAGHPMQALAVSQHGGAQAELAAVLLEEEWPDQRQAAAARAAAREAATPVPERVWALRNVGVLL